MQVVGQAGFKERIVSVLHYKAALIRAAILFLLLAVDPANAVRQHQEHRRRTKREQHPAPTPDLTPAAAPSPAPPTLEQMPALPPKVNFSNGLLTIVAENSTLGDILRAVMTESGAVLEMPTDATERVVTHLGPGPARDVMATLMNGSHFNYVMLGSAAQPDQVDRVILTPMSGGTTHTDSAAALSGPNGVAVPIEGATPPPRVRVAQRPVDDGAETAANTVSDEENQGGQPPVKISEEPSRDLQPEQQQQDVSRGEMGLPGPPPQ